jgi:hypothetical protein
VPLVRGTLDLLVLRAASGPLHGYGIATRIPEPTGGALAIEDCWAPGGMFD